MSIWQSPPNVTDFNFQSWNGQAQCAVCGGPARNERIFRPPHADDYEGFFDICSNCIREAADELGLAETHIIEHQTEELQSTLGNLLEELRGSRDALATVTRENVRLQDVIDTMNEPVETRFPDDFDGEDDGV